MRSVVDTIQKLADNSKGYQPKTVKNPSFKEASKLDANGKWKSSADHLFTIMNSSPDPKVQSKAFLKYVQKLINMTMYDMALDTLKKRGEIRKKLSGWEAEYFDAIAIEKRGWIYDLSGEYEEALKSFTKTYDVLMEHRGKTGEETKRMETANHFIGRSMVMQFAATRDKSYLDDAEKRFNKSIKLTRQINPRDPAIAVLGFQEVWLAKVDMLRGDLKRAENRLAEVKKMFAKAKKQRPGTGIMAYYHLLSGQINFEKGNFKASSVSFKRAYEINTEVVDYPNGAANALIGTAMIMYAQKDHTKARVLTKKAQMLNPNILKRGIL